MKNRLKIIDGIKLAIFISIIFCIGCFSAFAEKVPLEEMSFAELINSVELGKQAELVQRFQDREAKNVLLKNKVISEQNGCLVDAIRNKEVLVVTIPAGVLFGPNQTELLDNAYKYLEPFKRYLKEPDMYRLLVVMHTDNTGSEEYREKITELRAEAVADWFDNSGVDTEYLFPFAMSDDIPLVPNDSFVNREKNRRLEIYLVPGENMLEKAKKGRIAL